MVALHTIDKIIFMSQPLFARKYMLIVSPESVTLSAALQFYSLVSSVLASADLLVACFYMTWSIFTHQELGGEFYFLIQKSSTSFSIPET